MNLYYLRSKVVIRVQGISGPWEQVVAWLVHANDVNHAKQKYEDRVKHDFAHMQFQSITYEYLEVTGEVK